MLSSRGSWRMGTHSRWAGLVLLSTPDWTRGGFADLGVSGALRATGSIRLSAHQPGSQHGQQSLAMALAHLVGLGHAKGLGQAGRALVEGALGSGLGCFR